MKRVPDIAANEIERLRRNGVTVSDDDVVWLSCLGYRVENPDGKTIEAVGTLGGVRLSDNTLLRPLTLLAGSWLKRFGTVFGPAADLYAVAYAMAFPDKLHLSDPAGAVVDDVNSWTASLPVPRQELETAVSRMLNDDSPHDPDAKTVPAEKVVGLLVAATGLPAEYWDAHSWEQVDCVYSGIIRYAAMLSAAPSDPDNAESRASLRSFALAIQEITKRGDHKP